MRVFERLDLFGKPVLFNFGGYAKSKSRVGAIFTLGLLGFVIWVVYYFGKEIIQKKNPSVTNSESFRENPVEMQINEDTFVLNFGIQDKSTWEPFMNESIYTFQAFLYQATRVPQADGSSQVISESIPLSLEPCTKAHFGALGESFSYFGLSSMYCLSKNQPKLKKDLSILGKFESPFYQTIMLMGYLCDPSTSTVPCGSRKEMEEKLGFFQLQFSNTAVNPIDYDNPVTKFRDSVFTPVGNTLAKEVDFWVSPLEIKTDDGWLTNSYRTESFVQYSKVSEFVSTKQDSDPFVVFYLQADGVTRQYTRSYIKIQDVAARVNGIFSFALILLIIMVTPYVRLKFYEALIHHLFDVKISSKKIERSETKKPSLILQKLTRQKTDAPITTKNGFLTEGFSPRNQEIEFKVLDIAEKNEDIEISSPKGSQDGVKNQDEGSLIQKSQFEEHDQKESLSHEEETEEENTAQNLPLSQRSKKKKKTLKKFSYGSPKLLEAKPDLTKPTFKALMNENNDAFEDILLEMVVDNQLPEENDNIGQIASTERVNWVKREDRVLTQRDQPDNPENVKASLRKSPSVYLKNPDQIDLTFWEYVRSFVSETEAIKEKMYILNEGIRRINERLDIFNLLKKLRELDKLKILLLEDDQYILFEGLPKPEIVRESSGSRTLKHNIKNAKFIQEKVKNDLILSSYQNLKSKKEENLIDTKLLRIFDDILIE